MGTDKKFKLHIVTEFKCEELIMSDSMKEESVAALLKGIDRYNPENLLTLEHYVQMQAFEQTYNLDANLAVLKLYQFNPSMFKQEVTCQILLKALMNLPHPDLNLCKCLIIEQYQAVESVNKVIELSNLLETCEFQCFWQELDKYPELIEGITGFRESIKNFIASVLKVTYQNISRSLLKEVLNDDTIEDLEITPFCAEHGWIMDEDTIYISNQEGNIKSKNISERITFDNVALIIKNNSRGS